MIYFQIQEYKNYEQMVDFFSETFTFCKKKCMI